jgi:hypothetical protein
MRVTPGMTLSAIQSMREQQGLLSLRRLQVAGPLVYVAPGDRRQPWRDQVWEFVVDADQDMTPETMRINLISVP